MNADDFEELVESLNPINYLDFFILEDEDGCNEIEQLLEGLFAYLILIYFNVLKKVMSKTTLSRLHNML